MSTAYFKVEVRSDIHRSVLRGIVAAADPDMACDGQGGVLYIVTGSGNISQFEQAVRAAFGRQAYNCYGKLPPGYRVAKL